jgi:hypothetical protein
MEDVSLMVLSSGPEKDAPPPKFFILQKGVWRSCPPSSASLSLGDVRTNFEQRIDELMQQVAKAGPPESIWAWLKTQCMALLKAILPTEVENFLSRSGGPDAGGGAASNAPVLRLFIDQQIDWIPWELLHDGVDYLGLRYQVARLPIVGGGPDLSDERPKEIGLVYNLLGQGVVETNDALFASWQQTFANLIPAAAEHRRPTQDDWPLLNQVEEAAVNAADILHLTCHGGFKDSVTNQVYWTLNEDKNSPWDHRIDVPLVKRLALTKRPLIFGNACASSTPAANGSQGGFATGLGSEFFDKGALAFVGTFAPIMKDLAFDFAREFYTRLLGDGLPIGQALWATKWHYHVTGQNDPSWLFYCLYGPPETKFQQQQPAGVGGPGAGGGG